MPLVFMYPSCSLGWVWDAFCSALLSDLASYGADPICSSTDSRRDGGGLSAVPRIYGRGRKLRPCRNSP